MPSSPKRIGVVGSGGEWSALPAVRELGKLSHRCFILLSNLRNPAAYSRHCAGKLELPGESDDALFQFILDTFSRLELSHLLCLDENIKSLLVEKQNDLEGIKFAFPSFESYKTALEKNNATAFAREHGIPAPVTHEPKSLEEVQNIDLDFKGKVVVKGVRGASSSHVRYASTREEMLEHYNEIYLLEKDDPLATSLPIIQEFIGGPTYLTQGLARNGKVKIVVPHEKLREWPSTGGVSALARTIQNPRLVEYTRTMMEALDWHGEAGLEWKYDPVRDDFYFIEMNPRFEGSLDLAVKAGVNMPGLLLDIIDGKELPEEIHYRENVYYRWFFRNDFNCFLAREYGPGKLLLESLNPRVHGELSLGDPGVFRAFWKVIPRVLLKYIGLGK